MINKVLFSHNKDDYITPDWLMDELKQEFDFQLDACTDYNNYHAFPNGYTKKENGLIQPWFTWTYCNPPYSEVALWVEKAHLEAEKGNYSVMLLPARTDTKWFHEFIYTNPRCEVRFLKGRLKFKGTKYPAPFPSMIVIFR